MVEDRLQEKEINLEEFSHPLRYLIKNGIIESISDIYDYAYGRKLKDVSSISSVILRFSESMVKTSELAKNTNKFYSYRQKLVLRKQTILDDQSFMVSELMKLKKQEMVSYKVGTNSDGIRPSNETERRTLLDSNLSDLQNVIDVIDNHITFITDTIKNLSDMIYGFQYVLQFEEYRKNY